MNRTAQLNDYLLEFREAVVEAGEHDCALFIAGWVDRLCGTNHLHEWKGTYSSFAEGKEKLQEQGFLDHVEFIATELQEVPRLNAQVGDVAMVTSNEEVGMGIVGGVRVWVLRPDKGIGYLPLRMVSRVFRP